MEAVGRTEHTTGRRVGVDESEGSELVLIGGTEQAFDEFDRGCGEFERTVEGAVEGSERGVDVGSEGDEQHVEVVAREVELFGENAEAECGVDGSFSTVARDLFESVVESVAGVGRERQRELSRVESGTRL